MPRWIDDAEDALSAAYGSGHLTLAELDSASAYLENERKKWAQSIVDGKWILVEFDD